METASEYSIFSRGLRGLIPRSYRCYKVAERQEKTGNFRNFAVELWQAILNTIYI